MSLNCRILYIFHLFQSKLMEKIMQVYYKLYEIYGPQGWWPIVNNKTLLCEYHNNAPKNESEALEICFGAILTQGTQWYPNVVRAIQQLKLGRPFKKQELEVITRAEIRQAEISGNGEKVTKKAILTQNTNWKNVEKAIIQLNKNNLIDIEKILKINNKKLALIIKSSGYHNQKAKKLKNFSLFLIENYNGNINEFFNNSVKKLREELLSINGIGPETADSIILYSAKKPIFVIDAYTRRIMGRVGFKEDTYDGLQGLFMKNLNNNGLRSKCRLPSICEHLISFERTRQGGCPSRGTNEVGARNRNRKVCGFLSMSPCANYNQMRTDGNPKHKRDFERSHNNERLFNEYHALLVELGKNICKKKPLCSKCPINKMCNYLAAFKIF